MRLCVFGIESLDSLETAVSQSFSCVESFAGTTQLDFAQCGMPLRKEARLSVDSQMHNICISSQLKILLTPGRSWQGPALTGSCTAHS